MSPDQVDATEVWKIGAILKPAKTAEDDTLDVFAERMAAAQGLGPEPEPRAMAMADVIQITRRMRGGES